MNEIKKKEVQAVRHPKALLVDDSKVDIISTGRILRINYNGKKAAPEKRKKIKLSPYMYIKVCFYG